MKGCAINMWRASDGNPGKKDNYIGKRGAADIYALY